MKMKRKRSIICGLVGLILLGIALYTTYYITQIVDFTTTIIYVNNDPNLWKFLAYLPLLLIMFSGGVTILNGLFNLKTISVLAIILNVGTIGFIKYDLHGFVSIVERYNVVMDKIVIALIVLSLALVLDIVLNILHTKKKKPVNIEATNLE